MTVYKNERKPLYFIYQSGFRQISFPPRNDHEINYDVITITSCDDGVLITTDMDFEIAKEKLDEFVGYPVVEIWCDSHEIKEAGYFRGAEITSGNYGERVISLNWWKESEVSYQKGLFLYSHPLKETFQINEVNENCFVLLTVDGTLKQELNLTTYRFANMDEREQFKNKLKSKKEVAES
ncbi:hypothetical protein ACFVS2_20880 [Brevibacillus sp. NPDC058079]|uniref:hypothetical protein n=1 Tax=Brevibacillus sp. NPDC058079 TaxID=3346330 RepID=UPI0036ED2EE2